MIGDYLIFLFIVCNCFGCVFNTSIVCIEWKGNNNVYLIVGEKNVFNNEYLIISIQQ